MYLFRSVIFFTLFFSFSFSFSDNNSTSKTDLTYIDATHKTVSEKILVWTENLDTTLSGWLGDTEHNVTTVEKEYLEPANKRVKSVDSFFQNKKYFDETEETFVSLRIDNDFSTKESYNFKAKLGGQVALSKSKKRFKFFIDNVASDNVDNILEEDESNTPEFGLHYFTPQKYGIVSKYSVGLRGIHPFVRARYYMIFKEGEWYIEPSQIFKYSSNNKFEEESTIYFDRHFDDLSLFRFLMHRKTQESKKGMEYDFTLQYYWSPVKNIGLRVSQSFIGSTEYRYVVNPNIEPPQTKTYEGIYDYTSSLSLRHNIWRKWFFYEVRPGVSFHKEYAFEPNYTLRVFFDFHFGRFH